MRTIMKKFLGVLLAATFAFSAISYTQVDVHAETVTQAYDRDQDSDEVKALVNRVISFYGENDLLNTVQSLAELLKLDPEVGAMWAEILDFWDYIEYDMEEHIDVMPDGLENPDKHAIIVLGFALNADGTMTDELIGRLEVAKASALKYPESFVLVTGGVEKNGWTEGDRMHDWLVDEGIPTERIIIEKEAPHTAGNATNSFKLLYNNYEVDTVSLISSQYHVKRGSVLYYAESMLMAKELGVQPIEFLADFNAGWFREDKTSESLELKANSLRTIARVPKVDLADVRTEMTGLRIEGKTEYELNEGLDLEVYTVDSLGYEMNVNDFVTITGFVNDVAGTHEIDLTFNNRKESFTEKFEYTVKEKQDEVNPPVTPDPKPDPDKDKEETKKPTTTPKTSVAYGMSELGALATMLAGSTYLIFDRKRRK